MKKMNVVIYGATGNIGRSVLSIIRKNKKFFNVEGVTCNTNVPKLLKIADSLNIKKIGFNEKSLKRSVRSNLKKFEIFNDISDYEKMISKKTDIIVFANSGLSSLELLFKLLKLGKKIGIANKECIISMGDNFRKLSNKYSTEIVPLDSEHNSIYHLLKQNYGKFKSITITATGGPFINSKMEKLKKVTFAEAIKHPVWKMGTKISIDSATMMNKALEMIEAKYLFNLESNEINAIIHPQALVHALVNYENGMSTAIFNKPDMRIPISSLFFKFDRFKNFKNNLDLTKKTLEFIQIDTNKFPAIKLGYSIMKQGGLAPHVFNYINEKLVNLFINKRIGFLDIVKYNEINVERVFSKNSNVYNPKIEDLKNINKWIDNNLYIGN